MSDTTPLVTPRLQLVVLLPEALEYLVARDVQGASRKQGIELSSDFLSSLDAAFLGRQLTGVRTRPSNRDWFVRAIVRAEDDTVVGQCGFHGPPEDSGRVEIGYTVFERFRRNGYAAEAVGGLIDGARGQGATGVSATVSANNPPSIGLATKLGFVRYGVRSAIDEGEFLVFALTM